MRTAGKIRGEEKQIQSAPSPRARARYKLFSVPVNPYRYSIYIWLCGAKSRSLTNDNGKKKE